MAWTVALLSQPKFHITPFTTGVRTQNVGVKLAVAKRQTLAIKIICRAVYWLIYWIWQHITMMAFLIIWPKLLC